VVNRLKWNALKSALLIHYFLQSEEGEEKEAK